MGLHLWRDAIYFQIKERPRTVRQLAVANPLNEDEVVRLLGELESRELIAQEGDLWVLRP